MVDGDALKQVQLWMMLMLLKQPTSLARQERPAHKLLPFLGAASG
jgi:hypothetical protein